MDELERRVEAIMQQIAEVERLITESSACGARQSDGAVSPS